MRSWLLTNTLYGTWLPGDPLEDPMPELMDAAREQMRGPPIHLTRSHAETVLAQFLETATFRSWTLRAVAVMHNHFHLVVQVPGDPSPKKLLLDFKAYASRALNRAYGEPESETWWTSRGSKRKLKDDRHLAVAINYVLRKQPCPLVVWGRDEGRLV